LLEAHEIACRDLDLQRDAGRRFLDLDAEDVAAPRHDAFRQAEADGEVFEVGWASPASPRG
jgi:hypothetical protein